MEKNNIFRIAMLLYAESEGIRKKNTVLKKVIESAFVEKNNEPLSFDEIETAVKELYEISIAASEINAIIAEDRSGSFEQSAIGKKKINCLSDKRYQYLKQTVQRSIIEYIEEYVNIFNLSIEVKEEILSYMYELFQQNLSNFKAVIAGSTVAEEDIGTRLTTEQVKRINGFLQWENKDKDNALLVL